MCMCECARCNYEWGGEGRKKNSGGEETIRNQHLYFAQKKRYIMIVIEIRRVLFNKGEQNEKDGTCKLFQFE